MNLRLSVYLFEHVYVCVCVGGGGGGGGGGGRGGEGGGWSYPVLPMNLRLSAVSCVHPRRFRCPSSGRYLWNSLRITLSVTLEQQRESV